MQLDIFGHAPTKKKLRALRKGPIATRDEILQVQTEIMLDARSRPAERIKAAELICKINNYIVDRMEHSGTVKVVFDDDNPFTATASEAS
jgi:hypothetical protein